MNGVMSFFSVAGGLLSLLMETLYWCKSLFKNTDKILDQLLVIGYQTLPVGALIALFSGGVLALQAGPTLAQFGIEENFSRMVSVLPLAAETAVTAVFPSYFFLFRHRSLV